MPRAGWGRPVPAGDGYPGGCGFAIVAGDVAIYRDAGRLASRAGLAPVPRDSGRITGEPHRPGRRHRGLGRVRRLSAPSSLTGTGRTGSGTRPNAPGEGTFEKH
ncbi:transposase [Marinactinospora rubrisoli]|uniref:Transposase n=1 Tax=Marinactinospora rubrisoli TaxID=2715399 RepID=A0ABW2KDB8_9ACTN